VPVADAALPYCVLSRFLLLLESIAVHSPWLWVVAAAADQRIVLLGTNNDLIRVSHFFLSLNSILRPVSAQARDTRGDGTICAIRFCEIDRESETTYSPAISIIAPVKSRS